MEPMAEIKWNDRFNLDVAEIDKAHQKLTDRLHRESGETAACLQRRDQIFQKLHH